MFSGIVSAANMAMDNMKVFAQASPTKSSAFGWFGDAAKTVGNSINNHPDAWKLGAGLVGGAASGYMNAKTAKDQMKFQERMLENKMAQDEKFNERRASSGDNYDSHVNNLVGGTGLLAPAMRQ